MTRPSKICPNWDFLFENIPSGNPAIKATCKGIFFSWKLFSKLAKQCPGGVV
jgi:hypothetical protein